MKVGVIGGGVAGLTAAYELSRAGLQVTLFEAAPILGGLASSFQIEGGHLERFYHFICRGDIELINMLKELGLSHRLRWVNTTMGQFYNGRLYPFGEPWDLLFFPHFSWRDKLKFGWSIMSVKRQNSMAWTEIADVPAPEWLIGRFGTRAYEIIHRPLIELKFGDYVPRLSAAWMWARIHRVGKSRTRFTQRELLGYIDGGTHQLVNELERRLRRNRVTIHTGTFVQRILIEHDRILGLLINGEVHPFEAIISTVPSVIFQKLVEGHSNSHFDAVRQIDSIGVMCVLLRLKRPLTKHFWTNISDPGINLAGVVEYTNLNPCHYLNADAIIYLPQYLPSSSERFRIGDDELLEEYISYLKQIVPSFDRSWIKTYSVQREEWAQPICEVGFTQSVPGIETPVHGLYMTDSCQLHPDDRTVSNSIGLGRKAARLLLEKHETHIAI